MNCVAALDAWDVVAFNMALQFLMSIVSVDGHPLQRVAFTIAQALTRRAMGSLQGLAWALQLQAPSPPTPAITNAARQSFATMCPLIRIAATAANLTIMEAMDAERIVHVVDLGGATMNQWLELVRLFAARSRGPPSLRLSVVNQEDNFLSLAAGMLTQEAMRLHVPFEFNPVRSHIDLLAPADVAALGVVHGTDEALVITSTLQLHRLIADQVTIKLPAAALNNNQEHTTTTTSHLIIKKADALLRVLCDLRPKLMVLTEQEADHNCAVLSDRVQNAFDYYAALFSDMEAFGSELLGTVDQRVTVEHVLLREEVLDIIACDGVLRRERHEKITHWEGRMKVAGFQLAHVSVKTFKEIVGIAHQLSGDGSMRKYRVRKVDTGCLFLYSRMIPIFSVSAWRVLQKTTK